MGLRKDIKITGKDYLQWIGLSFAIMVFFISFYVAIRSAIDYGSAPSSSLWMRIIFASVVAIFFASLSFWISGIFFSNHLRLYHQIFEHSNEAIAVLSTEGKYLLQNLAHQELLKFSKEELITQEPEYYIGDRGLKTIDTLENLQNFSGEFKVKKADGKFIDVALSCFTITNELNDALFFVEFKRDISRLKKLEAEREEDKKKLELLSTTDALTGLYNRSKFREIAEYEILQNRRYNRNMSVIIFDIDFFKKVNDTYGHNAGDVILKQVSSIAKNSIRETDSVARWGGEEFLILLLDATEEQAIVMANNLREKIETTTGDPTKITCSFGVCQYREGIRLTKLVGLADEALYYAKENGRNRVIGFSTLNSEVNL